VWIKCKFNLLIKYEPCYNLQTEITYLLSFMSSRDYYNNGKYLAEHSDFLRKADPQKDVTFLVKALGLRKSLCILDVACGQGRHIEALVKLGYCVDGVDYSTSLLKRARETMKQIPKCSSEFLYSSIETFSSKKSYDVAYWFFSDLADVSLPKALKSLNCVLKHGGRILIDTDSVFRIVRYLQEHQQRTFSFDASAMELIDKKNNVSVTYLTVPQWKELMAQYGFRLESVYGDYDMNPYTIKSPRLIIIAKQVARAE